MYSEHDEELYILEAVKDLSFGTFLDIGAYDGIEFSNTRCLVERGWHGTMVEPGVEAFSKLLENYRDNYDVQLVHAAIGDTGPTWFAPNETTYSTTQAANVERFKDSKPFRRHFRIPLMTWAELWEGLSVSPDVVSIDTEGTSAGLLNTYPFQNGLPKVICVEHDGRSDWCDSIMADLRAGYQRVCLNETNAIYKGII